MANPQTQNGYTAIANELLEQIAKVPLNGTQHRIIDIVWRYTYGFNRKEHDFSVNFLLTALNLKKSQYRQVCRELKTLIDMGILIEAAQPTKNNSRRILFNKNYDLWTNKASDLKSPVDENIQSSSTKKSIEPLDKLGQQENKDIKQIIKQDIYSIFDYWNSKGIIQHRNLTDKIKRKISSSLNSYSESEIKTAINNYSTVLKGDQYYWSYTWTLEEFLLRGLDKFLSNTCFDNFLKKGGITDHGTDTNTSDLSIFNKSKFLANPDNL